MTRSIRTAATALGTTAVAGVTIGLSSASAFAATSLKNFATKQCITTLGDPLGYPVYQYPCNGSPNQTFNIVNVAGGFELQSQSNRGCIDNYGNSTNLNAVQVTEPCIDAANEVYHRVLFGGSGGLNAILDDVNECITSEGVAYGPVRQYGCNYNANQLWFFL